MSILNLIQVCVRFGGLTAVNNLDFAAERGRIFSIIGPNGAGKTTVFNAITGIYEPTSGTIEFEGAEMRRPFGWHVVLACALIGLLTALACMLLATDIDSLWRAVIKRNFLAINADFDYRDAWLDAQAYLRGELALEHNGRRWMVVASDSSRPLATESDEAAAVAARDRLQAVASSIVSRGPGELQEDQDHWSVRFGELTLPLGRFAGPAFAQTQLTALTRVAQTSVQRPRFMAIGFCLGLVLGAAGTYSVWARSRRTPEVVALGGIARTFQNIRLFHGMTVLENVLSARDRHFRGGPLAMALRTPNVRREEHDAIERAKAWLAFVGVDRPQQDLAKNLPYGDQRRLEIARALAAEPKLVLLDEPAAGMNPAESADLTRLIARFREKGITVLLIEHHMKVVMGISDHIAVLDYGVKIGEGTPAEVRSNPEVIKAYLGSEEVT